MTGRTHQRDCINFALSCCQEDPAPTCAAGNKGTLPTSEFTFADAAKASPLGDYITIHVGQWRADRSLSNAPKATANRLEDRFSFLHQWQASNHVLDFCSGHVHSSVTVV
jgi:hypothetical protein